MGKEELDVDCMVGTYPICSACGSRKVVRDAWAEWNTCLGDWNLKTVFDHFACDACGAETSPQWKLDEEFRKKRIRRLNDALRRGEGGNATIVVTAGVQANGHEFLVEVHEQIAGFDAFTEDNDPHEEHDFGAIEVSGEKLFWKVDYFDNSMSMLSPDPANPKLTHRVLTIMLASEY